MDEFRRSQVFLSVMLMLHLTVAEQRDQQQVTVNCSVNTKGTAVKEVSLRKHPGRDNTASKKSFLLTGGEDVTLPCQNKSSCDRITWTFTARRNATEVTLSENRRIHEDAQSKAGRLSVGADCSLVIQQVTEQDVGRYTCRQVNGSNSSALFLALAVVTEQRDQQQVTVNCSVKRYVECRHTVKWFYQGKDIDPDHKDLKTSESDCSASVTFATSHSVNTKTSETLKCRVTKGTAVKEVSFRKHPGSDNTGRWWWWILVGGGLAVLVLITAAAIRWKRAEGDKVQTNGNTADPEGGVCYASISFTKSSSREAQVRKKERRTCSFDVSYVHFQVRGEKSDDEDDEDAAVTYSTVKVSSAEHRDLYATINKANM
ncbi:uncharacterized protein LOC114428933 isoform X2 [Parambassis ranga]|uniref:Uncharacterized protein LOC114428933 isoform X2 n=1 Tax=Parambassis ranga TaxID=210632 RepID=A0A6P7HSK6_9TELE|nr:uncharacterized protein LOC114428933 isoform X2 [Parambassis ranga]